MKRRSFAVLIPLGLFGAQPRRSALYLRQRSYVASPAAAHHGCVFLYVGDIESTGGSPGFKPFDLHIIVGLSWPPFTGKTGSMSSKDVERLFANRKDIWRERMQVTRLSGESKTFRAPRVGMINVVIRKVVPVSGSGDHLWVDVF